MSSDPDEDALSWDGDDDRDGRRRVPPTSKPAATPTPQPTVAEETPKPVREVSDDADAPQGVGTVSLVLFGLLGGVYLLYTVGWALGGLGMQSRAMFMLPGVMYSAAMWVAVAAPALWFAAVLMLTRGAKDWVRLAGLVVGALLLVPWPFVMAGGGTL